MTNMSIKNTFVALSVVIFAAALSLGAFATTVHAEDDWGYGIDSGDWSYGIDSGDWSYGVDNGDWSYGVDNGDWSYGVDSGDWSYPIDYGCDSGCGDWSYPIDYCNCETPSYSYDSYDSYSPGYSSGYSYSMPTMRSTPTFYAPSYTPAPVYQQQRQQQTATVSPVSVVNNNNNTNNNNNVNNVSVVTPITQAQPIVQYVQPVPVYQPVYQQPTYPIYNQAPYCTITVTNGVNGLVTLYWSSSYATSAYITPSVGNVAPNGSTSLYTYGNTVYTMTVSGPGGTNTCRTQVYAPTTSVSLSQIPYTGFDFGVLGNAIYWMSLFALAASGAYLLVYYQGGAYAFVSGLMGSKKEEVIAPALASAPVAAPAPIDAPKADVFAHLPSAVSSSTKDSMTMVKGTDGSAKIVITRA